MENWQIVSILLPVFGPNPRSDGKKLLLKSEKWAIVRRYKGSYAERRR